MTDTEKLRRAVEENEYHGPLCSAPLLAAEVRRLRAENARLARERDALIDAAIWEGVDREYGGTGWTWQIGSWPPHTFLTTKEKAIEGVRRAAGLDHKREGNS